MDSACELQVCKGYKMPMQITSNIQKAYETACASRAYAHAPYSRFQVGAAVQIRGVAEPIGGCNVENASFGGTMCAERTAIFRAVARFGEIHPEFRRRRYGRARSYGAVPVSVFQVLAEFCADDMPVYLGNMQRSLSKRLSLRELLPHAFRAFKPGAQP